MRESQEETHINKAHVTEQACFSVITVLLNNDTLISHDFVNIHQNTDSRLVILSSQSPMNANNTAFKFIQDHLLQGSICPRMGAIRAYWLGFGSIPGPGT